ncbi:hypothetical protein PGTUg99_019345 [Puccinia graminis f. sp. tritici]|uniref:Uncharacterized protein n=1 Tax=Puccinia graminis f. sp. tritici TaxID=56615 RepID=A0A5B0MSX7_PUCGR|nr:hypothetical protein PGTUg99_019345 [Puccinia graminis f. sp. tritici]
MNEPLLLVTLARQLTPSISSPHHQWTERFLPSSNPIYLPGWLLLTLLLNLPPLIPLKLVVTSPPVQTLTQTSLANLLQTIETQARLDRKLASATSSLLFFSAPRAPIPTQHHPALPPPPDQQVAIRLNLPSIDQLIPMALFAVRTTA